MTAQQERGLTVPNTQLQTMADPRERDRLLRNLILPKATPEQFSLVLAICQRYGFDPLLRHVLIVGGNLYVTRDGLRHMAWQSGQFDGYDPPEERKGDDGKWIVTVKVYRKGIARPFVATAYQSEAENSQSPVWRSHPRLMTGKVAEVIALRMAFGVSLGGAEEIGFDDAIPQTNIGEARFVETRVRDVPPAQLAAPVAAAEESRFVATVRQMGEDGVTVREITDFINSEWDNVTEAEQLASTEALDAIKAERRAAKAARQQQPAAPIEATVVEASAPAEPFGWTELWQWARKQGFADRKAVEEFLGHATQEMTAAAIRDELVAQMPTEQEVADWDRAAQDDSTAPPASRGKTANLFDDDPPF
ncbi:MAG TPA: recombinase RecT [Thermomicrobiales bacterium]|jgi:hypothetical protein